MTVRVIRVLEYSFDDHAAAERMLSRSYVPANGVKFVGNSVIRSATTWPEDMPPERNTRPGLDEEIVESARPTNREALHDLADVLEEVQPPMAPEKVASRIRELAGEDTRS